MTTHPTPEMVALSKVMAHAYVEWVEGRMSLTQFVVDMAQHLVDLKELATRAATVPQGVSVDASEPIWTRVKPFAAGVYGVRGYQLSVDPIDQFEAIVAVRRNRHDELVCNMHECTTEDDLDDWGLVSDISAKFEWCRFVPDTTPPPAELGKGRDGR